MCMIFVSLAVQQAQSTFVGQEIGKGDIVEAKKFYKTICIISLILIISSQILIYVFRRQFVNIFINEDGN